jgi:hypothetical protein
VVTQEPRGTAVESLTEPDSMKYLEGLWTEIIGVSQVSGSDRFLDIGGNSLTLGIILKRVKSEKGVSLDPEPFFDPDRSSLAALAGQLDAAMANASS